MLGSDFLEALKPGKEIANATAWKEAQLLLNKWGGLVVFAFGLARMFGHQHDLIAVGDDAGDLRVAGPVAAQQVGLVGPAGLGRLAAIGAFDQRMQGGDIVRRRWAKGDVAQRRTPSSASR